MKKLFLMLAAAMLTASVSAQNTTITANKASDNWYVGLNAGAATPLHTFPYENDAKGAGFLKGFAPNVGLRVGKNLTTVFGLAAEGTAYFASSDKSLMNYKYAGVHKTFIDAVNVNLLATFNLMNLFAGYKGEPRTFEITALAGPGWIHQFDGASKSNGVVAKTAVDFALNLGADKAWQVYLEPAVIWGMQEWQMQNALFTTNSSRAKFDSRNALLQLNLGVNYKFGTSNGTHNYAVAQLRDQAEIDGLNAQINDARRTCDEKCAAKDAEIARLKKALADCESKPAPVVEAPAATNLQPVVLFRQGKSVIDAAQYASIEQIASYMKKNSDAKVEIKGYASPEGSAAYNQKLSEARANAVKNALVKKYGIAADRLNAVGCGATKSLSETVAFNRVATFTDK